MMLAAAREDDVPGAAPTVAPETDFCREVSAGEAIKLVRRAREVTLYFHINPGPRATILVRAYKADLLRQLSRLDPAVRVQVYVSADRNRVSVGW